MKDTLKKKDDYIFGLRALIEGIKNDRQIFKVYIKKNLNGELYKELMDLLKERNIPFQFVPIEKLNRITRKSHQGVIAFVSAVPLHSIEDMLPSIFEKGDMPFLLILDGVTDVRNFGAIARSAECAGVHAIVVPAHGSAQINSDAIKTSAGALHKIPVCRTADMRKTVAFIKESGVKIIGATEKGDQFYYLEKFTDPVALIMGSEENGISKELLKMVDSNVAIPIQGTIASLNVSVATGILLFEIVKQREAATSQG